MNMEQADLQGGQPVSFNRYSPAGRKPPLRGLLSNGIMALARKAGIRNMRKSTKSSARKTGSNKTRAKPAPRAKAELSPEYEEYLERHELIGEDRPRLSAAEFDKLDDELLDLLDIEPALLSDDQIVRIRELEFLLIDSD